MGPTLGQINLIGLTVKFDNKIFLYCNSGFGVVWKSLETSMMIEPYDAKKIGERIAGRLRELKIKKGDFAQQLGRAPARVSAWLNGDGLPDTKTFNEMARILQCSPNYLVFGQKDGPIRTEQERQIVANVEELISLRDPELMQHLSRELHLLLELGRHRERQR
jgi:transcriptional regulator with XRE-family HTH domain